MRWLYPRVHKNYTLDLLSASRGKWVKKAGWVKKPAAQILENVGTLKSEKQYQLSWKKFEEFRENNAEPTEEDYIEYMYFLKEELGFKASTLWSTYSMLNSIHQVSCHMKPTSHFPIHST